MRRLCLFTALVVGLALLTMPALADSKDADPVKAGARTFEIFTGTALNFRTNLRIEQSGQPDININADYRTRPFDGALYYDLRYAKWREGDRATEVELLHHKIYLQNTTADVPEFSITHGYNMLFLNTAWMKDGLTYRIGGGIVIAHPVNTVRGQTLPEDGGLFNEGFYLSGAATQFAVQKRFKLSGHMFASVEAKFTAAWARIKVVDGHADAPNVAVHGLVGIGYAF